MAKVVRVRQKQKYKSPNPLFEKWLKEWKESAAAQGLKTQYIFAKALKSLKRYPLPLSSGKEAKVLEYFGDKICSMLDERLKEHNLKFIKSEPPQLSQLNGSDKQHIDVNNSSAFRISENSVLPKMKLVPKVSSIVLPQPVLPTEPANNIEDKNFEDSFTFQPGSFDVILYVDSIETAAGHSKGKKQFLSELEKSGVPFRVRKLNVGDFLWVAKERCTQHELVLDFVVERKRLDDLSHSIKDGRFREQKFRLRNCGVRKPIYLIEYHSGHKYVGIPESTLEQAIVNTQVVDGFIVKRTQDIKESVAYLASMTKRLQDQFQTQSLTSGSHNEVRNSRFGSHVYLSFENFHSGAVKNKCLSVREMFAKQLLQFHGLSVDRALALVDQFQTPTNLFESLQSCSTEAQKMKLVSNVKFGKSKRSIGQALGSMVQQFYSAEGPMF